MKATHRYLEIVIILLLTLVHHFTGIWWIEPVIFLFLCLLCGNSLRNLIDYFISKNKKK